jgi:hypothetical protein
MSKLIRLAVATVFTVALLGLAAAAYTGSTGGLGQVTAGEPHQGATPQKDGVWLAGVDVA